MDNTDRRRFDAAISKLLFALNGTARPAPSMIGAYWSVLRGHKWELVAAAMTRALNDSTGHVSPAKLAELCRPDPETQRQAADVSRAQELQRRLDQADANAAAAGEKRHGPLWFNAEYRAILDVANMEFGRRLNGKAPGGFRFPTALVKGYDGKFDYQAVIDATPKPKGKTPDEHARVWDYFWQILREEFELFRAKSEKA